MLKIRLQRFGSKNNPSFRVIVVNHTAAAKSGKSIEKVGVYDPIRKTVELNKERIDYWMGVGAKTSDTVHNILINSGLSTEKKINVLPKKKPIVKEEEKIEEIKKPPVAEAVAPKVETAPEVKEEIKEPEVVEKQEVVETKEEAKEDTEVKEEIKEPEIVEEQEAVEPKEETPAKET